MCFLIYPRFCRNLRTILEICLLTTSYWKSEFSTFETARTLVVTWFDYDYWVSWSGVFRLHSWSETTGPKMTIGKDVYLFAIKCCFFWRIYANHITYITLKKKFNLKCPPATIHASQRRNGILCRQPKKSCSFFK